METIPIDLGLEILSFINAIEWLLSFRKVSSHWKKITHHALCNNYSNYLRHDHESGGDIDLKRVDDVLNSRKRHKFMKIILKKNLFEYAIQLERYSKHDYSRRVMTCHPQWILEEISLLKQYFGQFTRKNNDVNETVGFFGFLTSFFNSKTTNVTMVINKKPEKKPNNMKMLTDGILGAGKTTFLNSFANNYQIGDKEPNKVVDFESVTFCLSNLLRIQIYLWDICGMFSFRQKESNSLYYKNCSIVLLFVDPYNEYHVEQLNNSIEHIKKEAKDAEIILVSTKKDIESATQPRLISKDEMERIAFSKFGGLYLDISQRNSIDSRRIGWHCTLFRYLTDFIQN